MESGFANTYGVELLFEQPPSIDKKGLLAALRRRCGPVDPLDKDEEAGLLSFVHLQHLIPYTDGQAPAQTFMALSETGPDMEKLDPALQQTWDWPEARAAVERCGSTLLVTDFMSRGLEYKVRLQLFYNVLLSVLEVVPCLAIHWVQSQRVVDPAEFIDGRETNPLDPIYPAVNVRHFRIENRAPGETVMDTLGLAALGVPDLQCHFKGLEPTGVARMLYNTAAYLFQQGDVINDGETVLGIRPEHRWVCRHETSLVGPERIVLDVNPGPPHTAGNRN